MAGTLLCKLLQRKTYDVLAKKYTLLLLFVGFIIIFVSTLRFGETLMEWSKEKYSVVFSPYNNNIMGKSYRNMLCQYVPIDVVYTWVNGSDPAFLKELNKAKEEYGFLSSHMNCSFSNCVKSHMVLVRPQLPNSLTLSDLEENDSIFQHISNSFVVGAQHKSYENITVLVFPNHSIADQVLAKKVLSLEGQNYTLSRAYITDNWGSQDTVLLNNMLLLTQLPYGYSKSNILEKLPPTVRPAVSQIFIYEEKSMAVLTLTDPDSLDAILKRKNITFETKVASVSSAYLVIELPADHEDISASRFTDNEELRYSLRSLEKHAPWVRHVYIITNGQIPYWLNLDNPFVTIVTHEEIFPNNSHLPTFSSPAIEYVWPEDFYTHTKGQKVYLSWPVPNCAEGCPTQWVRDGYCNRSSAGRGVTAYFHIRASKNYCNKECADAWLADRYCDKACNVRECGFDAGDCGLDNFNKIPQIPLSAKQSYYHLPNGEHVGFFNLTEFLNSNYTVTDGYYEENPVIRTIAISMKYSVIGIVLYPNHNATNLTVILKGRHQEEAFEKKISLHTEEPYSFESFNSKERFPKIESTVSKDKSFEFQNINITASLLPENLTAEIQNLEHLLDQGILTLQGYLRKKSEMIAEFILTSNGTTNMLVTESDRHSSEINEKPRQELTSLRTADPFPLKKSQLLEKANANVKSNNQSIIPSAAEAKEVWKNMNKFVNPVILKNLDVLSIDYSQSRPKGPDTRTPGVLHDYFQKLKNANKSPNDKKDAYLTYRPTQRHLLDTFGDSLRHVNKLYNEAFGYEHRKVPSHIAHFVDKNVMSRLTERFSDAFTVTSSHRIRSSNDMQFAFSYYYYLMNEMETLEVETIFNTFDTDKSGTWSDREIRTVLTRLYDLPLEFSTVAGFEQIIINCSQSATDPLMQPSAPHGERYYDSKLPLVTLSLVKSCPPVSNMLLQHFGTQKKNNYETVGEEEVAFKMIHNNLSQVLGQIDDIRKHPKKFICLNDNMNHGTQEAEVIRAVIQDFYESLFPTRSQFELSPEYRNRFLYVSELREWRRTRDIIRVVTYLTLGILILFSVISFWKSEIRQPERYPRLRAIQNRHHNSQHV
ncbi:N-acetylglucosamine-1-phosphotransferase like protein [Argiope bruennichi]|uniref:N-acetylglucosamine-1-phosphotransferase like protein n=1 Tax=Argiope bruennichi TaxID=94029 RepID=A0A8T0G081_ARGBR|nr:N-acetylglucosamine-1-phosphotransferase like protein [Argiope bruennichi]